jgi:hypothetical protein
LKRSCNTAAKEETKIVRVKDTVFLMPLALAVRVEAEMQKFAKIPSIWDQ